MSEFFAKGAVACSRQLLRFSIWLAASLLCFALATGASAQSSCSGPPAAVLNGSYPACTSVLTGMTCPLTCNVGYTKNGIDQTCIFGVYIGTAPTCQPNSCTSPPAPVANGSYASCSLVASGSTCPLTCDAGYTKNGTEQTCTLGSYSGPAPTCDASFCAVPPASTPNGTYGTCNTTTVGGTCPLTCRSGYTKNGANPTCVGGSTWNGSPTCEPNSCFSAPAPVANGSYAACSLVANGDSCPLTCDAGYTKSGTEQTCTLGIYTGPAPTCEASFCAVGPSSTPNGTYGTCNTTTVGGACPLTCRSGYTKNGANPTCVGGSTWNGSPTCEPNSCFSAPAPVANGSYAACSLVANGNSCPLTCDAGYTKSGTEQTCTLGTYTGPAPTCDATSCTVSPGSTPNGNYPDCSSTAVGGTCPLTCGPGYTRTGAYPICAGGSTWNGSPTCEPNSCSSPPAPVANGSYGACSLVANGSSCPLTCDAGYTKSGTEQTCTLGTYTGPAPTCVSTTTTSTSTTMPPPPCAASPAGGCRQLGAGYSQLLIRNQLDDRRDAFQWKWGRGATTSLASFGSPLTGPSDYRVCLYDASANVQPLAEMAVAAAGTCDGDPCWSTLGTKGFVYKDADAATDGLATIKMTVAADEKGQLQVRAKGEAMPTPMLALTPPVTVQFVASDGADASQCWQSVYATPVLNTATSFRAKLP